MYFPLFVPFTSFEILFDQLLKWSSAACTVGPPHQHFMVLILEHSKKTKKKKGEKLSMEWGKNVFIKFTLVSKVLCKKKNNKKTKNNDIHNGVTTGVGGFGLWLGFREKWHLD